MNMTSVMRKKDFVRKLQLDEDDINELERATRDQAKSEKWKSERRYRSTSSKFHIISHRQRNHETFANSLMHPKSFTSRHTSHGIKYESEAIHAYVKQMNSRSMPVQVFKSGLVVYKKEQSRPGLLSIWKSHRHRLQKTIWFA